jgi:hypothetical protein
MLARARFRPLALIALLAAFAPARATMVEPMALERIAKESERIVHGDVVEVRSGRDAAGLPATWVTVAVRRTLKGPGGARLVFKQFGVTDRLPDGALVRIPGLPAYAPGEEAVLFLRRPGRLGFTSPVGFGQGVFRVRRRDGRARALADLPLAGAPAPAELDDFLGKVEGLGGGAR